MHNIALTADQSADDVSNEQRRRSRLADDLRRHCFIQRAARDRRHKSHRLQTCIVVEGAGRTYNVQKSLTERILSLVACLGAWH
jgi:hypothetical protein